MHFYPEFRISWQVFTKSLWGFDWGCGESIVQVGKTDDQTTLSLPILEHGLFLRLFSWSLISFISFSHLEPVYILLDSGPSISLFGANGNGLCFYFQFLIVHHQYMVEQLTSVYSALWLSLLSPLLELALGPGRSIILMIFWLFVCGWPWHLWRETIFFLSSKSTWIVFSFLVWSC